MKISRNLNLVIPIEDDNSVSYVHSTPISRETFEQFFIPISKTFSAIYGEGLGITAGPRIAAMMLRKIASDLGVSNEVESGLFAEIRRLSNFISPNGALVPLEDAVKQKMISEDDFAEVENALAFFIVASAMHKKTEREAILSSAAQLWGAQISSLNSTEFANSLKTSTVAANTGVSNAPSTPQQPSSIAF